MGGTTQSPAPPKGLDRAWILDKWNNRHWTIAHLAKRLNCTTVAVVYHLNAAIKAGEEVRPRHIMLGGAVLSDIKGVKRDPGAGNYSHSDDAYEKLTPYQACAIKLALQQHKILDVVTAGMLNHSTRRSLIRRGLMEFKKAGKSNSWVLAVTDRGQMASHIQPPLSVLLKSIE